MGHLKNVNQRPALILNVMSNTLAARYLPISHAKIAFQPVNKGLCWLAKAGDIGQHKNYSLN